MQQQEEKKETADLTDAAMIRYLTAGEAVFARTAGGLLSVKTGEASFPVVYLHCSFPHSNRRVYISVRTADNQEVGMIRSLDDFPEETTALLEEHTRIRYFAPSITRIVNIREEFGYTYWETETTAGPCRFTVRSGGHVKIVADVKLLVLDVDGNRFMIEDVSRLSDREYKLVEMCL